MMQGLEKKGRRERGLHIAFKHGYPVPTVRHDPNDQRRKNRSKGAAAAAFGWSIGVASTRERRRRETAALETGEALRVPLVQHGAWHPFAVVCFLVWGAVAVALP